MACSTRLPRRNRSPSSIDSRSIPARRAVGGDGRIAAIAAKPDDERDHVDMYAPGEADGGDQQARHRRARELTRALYVVASSAIAEGSSSTGSSRAGHARSAGEYRP